MSSENAKPHAIVPHEYIYWAKHFGNADELSLIKL